MLETPSLATESQHMRIPLESARAGTEDDSLDDNMVMTGPETTTSNESTAQENDHSICHKFRCNSGPQTDAGMCLWLEESYITPWVEDPPGEEGVFG